ncbi:hypothetical protein C8R43DRAFT_963849 [Mycena crocata]|nr:hypothetical protein C8R43DRAFT_963849 [Mycena crocata]
MAPPNLVFTALLAACVVSVSATSLAKHAACQSTLKPKFLPTLFCPEGTLYVSQTDPSAHFTSVQAAITSLPHDTSPAFILIGAGTYQEAVNVSRKGPTTLLGRTDHPSSYAQNLVTIFNTTFINQTTQIASLQDNADSAVLTVAPNKYAAWTGAGYYGETPVPIPDVRIALPVLFQKIKACFQDFGCTDFKAYNINFENRAPDFIEPL